MSKVTRITNKQVDFSEIFRNFFLKCDAGVSYRMRCDSNWRHDLQFISGLIHDSRIMPSECRIHRKVLYIPLLRDRWELLHKRGVLDTIQSKLVIGPVKEHTLCLENALPKMDEDRQFMVTCIESENYGNSDDHLWRLSLCGDDWRYKIILPYYDFRVEVKDVAKM